MQVSLHGIIRNHQDSQRGSGVGQAGGGTTSFASLIDNQPGGGTVAPPAGGGSSGKTPPVGGAGSGNPNMTTPIGTLPLLDLSGIGNLPGAFAGNASMLADMVLADGGSIADLGVPQRSNQPGLPSASQAFDIVK